VASVRSALRQLEWHVKHTQRYIVHQAQNLRLEAEHGLSDDPDWHLSGAGLKSAQTYVTLLSQEFDTLKDWLANCASKQSVLTSLSRRLRATQRALKLQEAEGTLHPITSELYARSELIEVLLLALKDRVRIPRKYHLWNRFKFNGWFQYEYIPDVGALGGQVYGLSHVSRLVLYEDRLQVRWMTGRVLLEIPYSDITAIWRHRRQDTEQWTFVTNTGQRSVVTVTGVWNRSVLESDLLTRCPQVSRIETQGKVHGECHRTDG
jgi:hypothetical protein